MDGIDIQALQELRASSANMIAYYGENADKKREQNAAMEAAGLKPLHEPYAIKWDADLQAKHERYVAALDAAITLLSPPEAEAA